MLIVLITLLIFLPKNFYLYHMTLTTLVLQLKEALVDHRNKNVTRMSDVACHCGPEDRKNVMRPRQQQEPCGDHPLKGNVGGIRYYMSLSTIFYAPRGVHLITFFCQTTRWHHRLFFVSPFDIVNHKYPLR